MSAVASAGAGGAAVEVKCPDSPASAGAGAGAGAAAAASASASTTSATAAAAGSASELVALDPLRIRFTQKQAAKKFSCGRSVCDTIAQLRAGTLSAAALPPLNVVAVGGTAAAASSSSSSDAAGGAAGAAAAAACEPTYWSLDNRRLFALQQWAKAAAAPVTVGVRLVRADSEFTKKRGTGRGSRAGTTIAISNLTFHEKLIVL